jgi:hypothetical protein
MSPAVLAGVLAAIAVSAGLVWLALKGRRTPTEDRVTGNVLARINTEYRDRP